MQSCQHMMKSDFAWLMGLGLTLSQASSSSYHIHKPDSHRSFNPGCLCQLASCFLRLNQVLLGQTHHFPWDIPTSYRLHKIVLLFLPCWAFAKDNRTLPKIKEKLNYPCPLPNISPFLTSEDSYENITVINIQKMPFLNIILDNTYIFWTWYLFFKDVVEISNNEQCEKVYCPYFL